MKKEWVARELTMEVTVGAFMVLIFLGLCYFTIILSKDSFFGRKTSQEVVFNNIMGLGKGDRVVVRGMTVGKVNDLVLQKDGVHVFTTLDQDISLKTNCSVTVVTASVLGGRYLEISEGSADAPALPKGTVVRGKEPFDLVADAAEMINSIKKGLSDGKIIENLQQTLADVRDVVGRVNAGKGTIGKLLSEDDKLYRDLSDSVASIKTVTGRLEKGEGTLGKLMSSDDKLYKDLSEAIASLKNISAGIERGDGVLGKLVKDEKLYKDIQSIVSEARATLDDFRETAPITTFSSVFFGSF